MKMRIKPERNKRTYKNPTHESISPYQWYGTGRWQQQCWLPHAFSYSLSNVIYNALNLKNLPERETKTNPFYIPKKELTLRRRSGHTSFAITPITNMLMKPFGAWPFISIMLNILFCFFVRGGKREWGLLHDTHVTRSALIQMFIQFLLGVKN